MMKKTSFFNIQAKKNGSRINIFRNELNMITNNIRINKINTDRIKKNDTNNNLLGHFTIKNFKEIKFLYNKIQNFYKLLIILNILSVFLLIIKRSTLLNNQVNYYRNYIIIINIFISIYCCIIYVVYLKIKIKYLIKKKEVSNNFSLYKKSKISNIITLIIMLSTSIINGKKYNFNIFDPSTKLYLEYNVNDILDIISYFKIYVIFVFFLKISKFNTERSIRVNNILGNNINSLYLFKCFFKDEPLKCILFYFLINIILFGGIINILEYPYIAILNRNNYSPIISFNYIINCYWNSIITMTTVGYGDYYPATFILRLVYIFYSILGITIVSLITCSLISNLNLEQKEFNSYILLKRINLKNIIIKNSNIVLNTFLYLTKSKDNYNKIKYKINILNKHLKINKKYITTYKRLYERSINNIINLFSKKTIYNLNETINYL